MKIVSLLSSATEIVYELGLQEHLVGISHECDFPPEALRLPRLSRSRFDPDGLSSGEIDREVRRCMEEFGSVYEVDVDRLREVQPDVVLTQAVCEVCAVPTGSVEDAVEQLPDRPAIVSLDAHDLDGILATVQQVATAAGDPERGKVAVARLQSRIGRIQEVIAEAPGVQRPRVLALEWLDPPFAPGHWVPEMIEIAGGENLLGEAGARSRETAWEELRELAPHQLLLLPCGYDLPQARTDANRHAEQLKTVASSAIDAGHAWLGHGSFFSRSGPRVVGGIEALARVFHSDLFPDIVLEGHLEQWK